jgi:heme oxygenase
MMKLATCLAILQIYGELASAFVTPFTKDSLLPIPRGTSIYSTAEAATDNPRLSGLAFMLDDGTRKSHSIAENTSFVTGFFKGLANRDSYKALMTSLYFVYTAMEESMDETSCKEVNVMDYAALRRLGPLERDMEYFYGEEWASSEGKIQPSPATKTYVARIQEISKTQPYLLVAHQYTRYLGDLFGGQMMGGMATRSLNLKNGDGVAFYNFDDIASNNNFITGWYQKLNDLDLTEEQKQDIVDEANLVFALNIGILQELEGSPIKAIWTLAISSLKTKLFKMS